MTKIIFKKEASKMDKIIILLFQLFFLFNCSSTSESIRLGASIPNSQEKFDERVKILKQKISVLEKKRGQYDEFNNSYENQLSVEEINELEKLKKEYNFIKIVGMDRGYKIK